MILSVRVTVNAVCVAFDGLAMVQGAFPVFTLCELEMFLDLVYLEKTHTDMGRICQNMTCCEAMVLFNILLPLSFLSSCLSTGWSLN